MIVYDEDDDLQDFVPSGECRTVCPPVRPVKEIDTVRQDVRAALGRIVEAPATAKVWASPRVTASLRAWCEWCAVADVAARVECADTLAALGNLVADVADAVQPPALSSRLSPAVNSAPRAHAGTGKDRTHIHPNKEN
jgi:hypothetical protein